jgi:hypothetical protein
MFVHEGQANLVTGALVRAAVVSGRWNRFQCVVVPYRRLAVLDVAPLGQMARPATALNSCAGSLRTAQLPQRVHDGQRQPLNMTYFKPGRKIRADEPPTGLVPVNAGAVFRTQRYARSCSHLQRFYGS